VCVGIKRHHQYAARIAVESMHDASRWPLRLQASDQAIGLLRSDAWNGEQPACLVHYKEMLIGMQEFVTAMVHSLMVERNK
jgi:hypothetical protein